MNKPYFSSHRFAQALADPPAAYRPQLLWVWNGEVTRQRITQMLEDYAAQGMGGVFVHPRAGLVTEYLSEAWFDLWAFALSEAKRLGLFCHIYDENSYPSGFAGGHVVASNPMLAGTCLKRKRISERAVLPKGDHAEVLLLLKEAAPEAPRLPTESVEGKAQVALVQEFLPPGAFQANFPYVDLLRPEVTKQFLALTHARYAERFQEDFGSTIRFAFADEPLVCEGGLPMSAHLRRVFKRNRGYDLIPYLADLYTESDTSTQTRFDYWLTVHELFVAAYLKPIHDWCEAHGLSFTGHFHETAWPEPKNQPSTMAALRWMHAPGNDLLGFQFKPTTLRENGIYVLNLKELDSVKRQCGREHSLVESTGGGGYESGPAEFKPLEDFLLSQGVNLINPHLGHQTLAGARKYDWPHTISDHAPWFKGYRSHARHLARINLALCQGEAQHPILLLHPSTSGWLHYAGPTEGEPEVSTRQTADLRESQIDLICSLHQRGLEFDLGDELMLAEMGANEGNRLSLGSCIYETLILPRGTINFPSTALSVLESFVAGGGRLLAETSNVPWIDGRPSERFTQLIEASAILFSERGSLLNALAEIHPPAIRPVEGDLGDLCWRKVRTVDGKSILFLCNPFDASLSRTIDLGNEVLFPYDTFTGEIGEPLQEEFVLELGPRDHLLLLPESLTLGLPRARGRLGKPEAVTLEFTGAEAVAPNVWALDYGDLRVNGETVRNLNTFKADQRNWREQGFRKNPWSFSIQYRQNFLDAVHDPAAEFCMTYPFEWAEDALSACQTLKLAVERAELYTVRVNGHFIDFTKAHRWFDESITAAPIGDYVHAGLNHVELHCRPFHPLAEIMPVYLLGDFSLQTSERGFKAIAPQTIGLGDWTRQGRPFDPQGFRYHFVFTVRTPVSRLHLHLPKATSSLVCASVDGKPIGETYRKPYVIEAKIPIEAGTHELTLELRGNLINLLGPHFCDGLPGPWSWDQAPQSQPPGVAYRRLPTGLFEVPLLSLD